MQLDKLIIMQRLSLLFEGMTSFAYTDISGVEKTVTYNLAGKVFRGRKTVSVEECKATGAMSILEAPRAQIGDPAGVNGVLRKEPWTLNVQGWAPEDRLNPSDPAYIMAAAARARMSRLIATNRNSEVGEPGGATYPADYLVGKFKIDSITLGATIVSPASEDLSAVAFFYIPLVISFVQRT